MKSAKKCLKNRPLENENKVIFQCSDCLKNFTTKQNLNNHQKICVNLIIKKINLEKNQEIQFLEEQLCKKNEEIEYLKLRFNLLESIGLSSQQTNDEQKIMNSDPEMQQLIRDYAEKIRHFERKYIQKNKRTEYPNKFLIYVITNSNRELKNEYKIGKTQCLTRRLSSYNTSEDHKVIFYQECDSVEEMDKLEKIVFLVLSNIRVQANREWFCGDITEIIRTIKECKYFINRGKKD